MAGRRTVGPAGVLPVDALRAPHQYKKYLIGNYTQLLFLHIRTRQLRLVPIEHNGDIVTSADVKKTIEENFDMDLFEERIVAARIVTPVVGQFAFAGLMRLEYVELMDSVTTIETAAFKWTSLKEISIPSSVTIIGRYAFSMTPLISLTIPPIYKIPFGMCESQIKLLSVKIPEGVKIIDHLAFYRCRSLEYIDIPKSVIFLGIQSLGCCSKLKIVRLQNGLTSIDEYAFAGCSNLRVLVIPQSVELIGIGILRHCYKLQVIVNLSNVELYHDAHMFAQSTVILKSMTEFYKHDRNLFRLYFKELRTRMQAMDTLNEIMPGELTNKIMDMVDEWGPYKMSM